MEGVFNGMIVMAGLLTASGVLWFIAKLLEKLKLERGGQADKTVEKGFWVVVVVAIVLVSVYGGGGVIDPEFAYRR